MKKSFAYIVLLFFLIVYTVCSGVYMRDVTLFKCSSNSIFGSDKYKYGDLFGMSYFPKIKELSCSDSLDVQIEKFPALNKITLCLVHDSYLGESFLKSKNQFIGVDTIYDIEYPWWRNKQSIPIQLDSTKTNVLVFEIVERHINNLSIEIALNLVKFDNTTVKEISTINFSFLKRIKKIMFNNYVNANLEFFLFDSRIFTPFKELKSFINYTFFHRTNTDVFLSKNSKYLIYSPTKSSIQHKVTDGEIAKTINTLNEIYNFYKNKGFDEVYFSIIPNPVSIIKPDSRDYNNLIPLIQNDQNLKMQMIDIYSLFKHTNYNIYYHSDTHWNKNGFQLWANEFNRTINESKNKNK